MGRRATMSLLSIPLQAIDALPFRDPTVLGKFVVYWRDAIRRVDPTYRDYLDVGEAFTGDAINSGFLVWTQNKPRRLRHTGPRRQKYWLLPGFDQAGCFNTYVVHDADRNAFKIGRATDIERRVRTLQISSPSELKLVAAIKGDCEAELHRLLGEYQIRGEWFRVTDESIAIIKKRGR